MSFREIKSASSPKSPDAFFKSPGPKNILFACGIANGMGDLGHLIDTAGKKTLDTHFSDVKTYWGEKYSIGTKPSDTFSPVYLLVTTSEDPPEKIKQIILSVIENSIAKQITHYPADYKSALDFMEKNLVDYIAQLMLENPNFHLIWVNKEYAAKFNIAEKKDYDMERPSTFLQSYLEQEGNGLKQQLKQCRGIAYASIFNLKRIMHQYLQPGVAKTLIAEHESALGGMLDISVHCKHLGFNPNGVFLHHFPHYTLGQKAELLTQFTNRSFLKDLVGEEKSEVSPASAHEFLKQNLFAPGYFHTIWGTVLFVQSLAISALATPYQNCVFLINEKLFNKDLLDKELLAKKGFTEIVLMNNGKITDTISIKAGSQGKKIILMSGYQLNDHDFDLAYQIAQVTAGCSGDKTLEKALSHHLIPFYERDHWKRRVVEGLLEVVDKHKDSLTTEMDDEKSATVAIANLKEFINLYTEIGKRTITVWSDDKNTQFETSKVSKQIAALLTPELMKIYDKLIEILHKKYNFFDQLTDEITTLIAINRLYEAIIEGNDVLAKKILEPYTKDSMKLFYMIDRAYCNHMNEIGEFIKKHYGDMRHKEESISELCDKWENLTRNTP